MSKFKRHVIKGLGTMNLCAKGREIFGDSIASGEGPAALEPHLEECTQCKKAIDALIDKIVDMLFNSK